MADDDKKREDDREHEEKQVDRLIKPSPKKKPPRTDKEKRRIEVNDDDLKKEDKDLSLNRKDIGGRVVVRYLKSFSYTPRAELAEKQPEKFEAPERTDDELKDLAIEMYNLPDKELLEKLDIPLERDIAKKVLKLRQDPLPPSWKAEEEFVEAQIRLKGRRKFRKHMERWDAASFLNNITYFKEKKLNESLTSGRQDKEDYYQHLLDMAIDSYDDYKLKELRPLKDLREAMETLKDPTEKYVDPTELEEASEAWKARLKRTPVNNIDKIDEDIDLTLKQDVAKDTNFYHWLMKLKSLLAGARSMQEDLDPRSVAASIRRGMNRAAQYRGAPGYIPRENLPDAPTWGKPDPREIAYGDFAQLLVCAVEWLNSDFIKQDLLEYDPMMACRIALDYAIYGLDEGKYQSRVDAHTYERLVGVLQRVLISP